MPAVGASTHRILAALSVAALSVGGLLGACSDGASAPQWAGEVCRALTPWRRHITDLNEQAQREVARAATPAQTKANLLALLSGAESASETALAQLTAAGAPRVEGGEEVAGGFVASLRTIVAAYARARQDLTALPVEDEDAFYDGVTAVMTRLTNEYAGNGVDFATLESPELRAAFDQVQECQ